MSNISVIWHNVELTVLSYSNMSFFELPRVDKSNPYHLENAPLKCRNSYDYVYPLVQELGGVLEFASSELQNNFEIVLTAVQSTCLAILFASHEMKANPTIFRAAYLNGFKNFICPQYINYLYEVGDNLNAEWVRTLYQNECLVSSLLESKNSCDFDISSPSLSRS